MRGGIRITERKIQEMIEEGRGSGELGDYKPSDHKPRFARAITQN